VPELFVYRPGAIGDALLAVPALRALRHLSPAERMTLATNPAIEELVLANHLADSALSQDDPELLWLFAAGPPPGSSWLTLSTAVLWSGGASPQAVDRLRAGGTRVVQVASRPSDGSGEHVSDYLLRTLGSLLGAAEAPPWRPLCPPARASLAAEAWLQARGAHGERLIALHPGSGSDRKNWPSDRYGEAAEHLERQGYRVLVSFGPADDVTQAVLRHHPGWPDWLVARDLDVTVLAALLARCAGYLGNDSGVSHLAAAMGTPTVALFGPSDPRTWEPRGARVRVLADPGWRRMRAAEVADAVLELAR
jgi:ADP-heptose:LPS heptosyltransferase